MIDCLRLVMWWRLMSPKMRLEVTTSRVERLRLAVTRHVLLLGVVGRGRSRLLLRLIRSSWRHSIR